jgi:hypothetical protein
MSGGSLVSAWGILVPVGYRKDTVEGTESENTCTRKTPWQILSFYSFFITNNAL